MVAAVLCYTVLPHPFATQDFVAVAGPLGVSHFLVLSATEQGGRYLRLAKPPRVRGLVLFWRLGANQVLRTGLCSWVLQPLSVWPAKWLRDKSSVFGDDARAL